MAIIETDPVLLEQQFAPTSAFYNGELPIPEVELELEARFEPERLGRLTTEFLADTLGENWREVVGTRQFFVGLIPGDGEFKDVAAMPETTRFARTFNRPASQIYTEYSEFDSASTFIALIDVQSEVPKPAGAIRIIEPNEELGFKTTRDFIADSPTNPWLSEIQANYFAEGEQYNEEEAWKRLSFAVGEDLELSTCYDVTTLAVLEEYATSGAMDGPSLALYHTCLRYGLGRGLKNIISIQDIKPLDILQSFGKPFSLFPGIEAHPNEGPYDCLPAFCTLENAMENIRGAGDIVGDVFVDGAGLKEQYVLIQEYMSEQFSNETLGLPTVKELV